MAIIINEFEIVTPPDSAASRGSHRPPAQPASDEAPAASTLQPSAVETIVQRALQRRLRVWAD
jgi:hypothetical protein